MNENEKTDGIEWFCNDFVKIQRDETEEERIEINPFCFAQVIIIVNNQIPFHFHRFWTKGKQKRSVSFFFHFNSNPLKMRKREKGKKRNELDFSKRERRVYHLVKSFFL
eukprot:TRINITY_DN1779_c0_g1_i8.p1 TRINITY_DN1779_c0_g1~~TRINITY_DN1779_c0_g1_i8.p1  ORF type:complete len:125 (+),score=28.92 TRINITY_DN1779_c0_g1_i8:49-375(+)